ncbi:MAG: DUF2207 domain-containing protein [Clostridiales bacterium]|nr:DUF2207 domain-containing protein [Clostridiales bacterium]
MKKTFILTLALILALMSFSTLACLAEGEEADPWFIESYAAFADIRPDGSMKIEEYISYRFAEDFPGTLKRRMDTFAASGLDELSIYSVEELDTEDIRKSKKEPIQEEDYIVNHDQDYGLVNGIDITLGEGDKSSILVFEYTLHDLVGIYKDMALLDWTFLDDVDSQGIEDIFISIDIPKGGSLDTIHSTLFGPLYNQEHKEGNTISYEARLMDQGRSLSLTVLMPISIIPDGRKTIENEITQNVLSGMEEYEKEIEAARKDYETRQLTIDLLTYITIGLIVAVGIYLYFRYDKDPKLADKPSHINELPADYYTPAELGVFMNRGRVRVDYIVATLMDLVNRGYLNLKPSEDEKYILSKKPDTEGQRLKAHEEYLLAWIFDDFGEDSSEVSIVQIEKWFKDPAYRERYKYKYKTWSDLVEKQASKWKFFENLGVVKLYGLLLGILTAIPGIILYTLEARINGIVIIGLSVILMMYSQLIQKRTEFGAINRYQWLGFKKYVKEASSVQLPRPELDQWERFLAYAMPLDVVDVMIEQLHLIYDANALKEKRLSLLHSENIDKTLYWINSLGTGDGLWERLLGSFKFPGFKAFRTTKKG